jgi:conjugal transfer pilus assembly protein TraE
MKESRYRSMLTQFQWRRNLWMGVALAMVVSNLALSAWVLTTDTTEKTIVVPPSFEKKFWVQGDAVSPEYIEQMAVWFANLALTYNPDNIDYQAKLFLRYAEPASYGALSAQFAADSEKVRRNRVSSVFYPREVKTTGNQVVLDGDLITWVGSKMTETRRGVFELQFVYRDSRLFVLKFQDRQAQEK